MTKEMTNKPTTANPVGAPAIRLHPSPTAPPDRDERVSLSGQDPKAVLGAMLHTKPSRKDRG